MSMFGKQAGSAERFDGYNNVGFVMEGSLWNTLVAYGERIKSPIRSQECFKS